MNTHLRLPRGRNRFASLVAATSLAVVATGLLAVSGGVATAADGSYKTITKANNPSWMKRIADGTSLAAMSIPGTHESMAIHGGALTQTQEDHGDSGGTLNQELNSGIRAIDIRLRISDKNSFTVHHGPVYQKANFTDVLNTIGGFLDRNPSETVLMRVKHECTGAADSCKDAKGQKSFEDIFDMYRNNNNAAKAHFWGPSTNRTGAASTPNLGEVRGKIVLLVMQGPRGGRIGDYGLAGLREWKDGSSDHIQDDYNVPNIGAIATKRDRVRRFLDKTNSGARGQLYINFTSGASPGAYPYSVAGGSSPQQGVNPFLLGYLTNAKPRITRTGIVMMDFPGGELINKIISAQG